MHAMSHNCTAKIDTSNGQVHRASISYVSDMENGEFKTLSCTEPLKELDQASIVPSAGLSRYKQYPEIVIANHLYISR